MKESESLTVISVLEKYLIKLEKVAGRLILGSFLLLIF